MFGTYNEYQMCIQKDSRQSLPTKLIKLLEDMLLHIMKLQGEETLFLVASTDFQFCIKNINHNKFFKNLV